MKHLKNFITFINEGAWYDEKGKVFLSKRNNTNIPTELLKTSDPNSRNFDLKKLAELKVYYGLYPVEKFYGYPKKKPGETREEKEERLRIKREKVKREEEMQGSIMKKLKSDDYSMAPGESMEEFLLHTIPKNIRDRVDYVVRIGSSEGLVKKMADHFKNIYPSIQIIDIPKIEYFSAEETINWEEYEKKVQSELSIPRYDSKGNPLPSHSRTKDLVKEWIEDINKMLEEKIKKGDTTGFNIRSSGKQGGVRSALKPKYDTASEEFINAVHHCVFGNAEGDFGKMIIIDDNVNQGNDFRDISHKILEILAGIIDLTKNVTAESLVELGIFNKIKDNYQKIQIQKNVEKALDEIEINAPDKISNNIIGYVLYGFQTQREISPENEYTDIILDVAAGVIADLNLTEPYPKIYKSNYNKAYDQILDRSLEEIKTIDSDPDAVIRGKIIRIINREENRIFNNRRVAPDPQGIKYPNTADWAVGDILSQSRNPEEKVRISSIDHLEGRMSFVVLTGRYQGKEINNVDLIRAYLNNPENEYSWKKEE